MTTNLKVLVALAIFATGLAAGWVVNGWRKDVEISRIRVSNAEILRGIANKTDAAVRAFRATETAWRTRIEKEKGGFRWQSPH
ncbi:hypothetical protein [Diaphorobacter ruginosibacter]|uniref:hypothetical protein n=1 Tax=Diaphorobacter ruginosibacter TaxID=1715720 RepID=UPI001FE6339C|nr:hypothetical protein [Diaphorobacter ruginosibacter]